MEDNSSTVAHVTEVGGASTNRHSRTGGRRSYRGCEGKTPPPVQPQGREVSRGRQAMSRPGPLGPLGPLGQAPLFSLKVTSKSPLPAVPSFLKYEFTTEYPHGPNPTTPVRTTFSLLLRARASMCNVRWRLASAMGSNDSHPTHVRISPVPNIITVAHP